MNDLPLHTRLGVRLGHLYPFLSGRGRVANSRWMRALDPSSSRDVIVKVVGGNAVVPSDDYVGRAMLYTGDLDGKISALVDACVQPGDVALDIGANLGLVSLRMADRAGPEGAVHAFEPSPRLAPYLSRTLAANPGLKITHHPIALGREQAVLPLHVPAGNAGAATLQSIGRSSAQTTVEVPVHRLSDYADDIDLQRVDFVKIDVEGFETEVIIGARELFERCQPKALVLEEHAHVTPANLPPSLHALKELEFDLYALPKRLFRLALVPLDHPEAMLAHDYVAISKNGTASIRQRLGL